MYTNRVKNFKSFLTLAAMVLIFGPVAPFVQCVFAEAETAAGQATLYQRLGGYDGISTFVDTAFPKVAGHPKLEKFFTGHSDDSKYRQRQLIIEFLCRETGGTCVYTGRPMNTVHAGLQITQEDWTTFTKIISSTLTELKVSDADKNELLGLFEKRFKPEIVEKP
ncbi:group 1 truncated hemoglobin [bacterium]|nr:group 1 truncated hemoglobin [bacterium]